jgi:hypothetical protein
VRYLPLSGSARQESSDAPWTAHALAASTW